MDLSSAEALLLRANAWHVDLATLLLETDTLSWKPLDGRRGGGLTSCLWAHWLCNELRSDSGGPWVREPLMSPQEPHTSVPRGSHYPAPEEGLQAFPPCPVDHIRHGGQPWTFLQETAGRQERKKKTRESSQTLPALSEHLPLLPCLSKLTPHEEWRAD